MHKNIVGMFALYIIFQEKGMTLHIDRAMYLTTNKAIGTICCNKIATQELLT